MSSRIPDPKIEQRNDYVKGKSSPSASGPRKVLSVTELSAITGLALACFDSCRCDEQASTQAGHGKGGCKDQGEISGRKAESSADETGFAGVLLCARTTKGVPTTLGEYAAAAASYR